jgi:hypothetical protein
VEKAGFKVCLSNANLRRYASGVPIAATMRELGYKGATDVGLCRLNHIDSFPITYSLSNP